MISLNSHECPSFNVLEPAVAFRAQADGSVQWDQARVPLDDALARDTAPLPVQADREGYYGPNHFNYWASGLRDICQIAEWADRHDAPIRSALDIGCASGRIIRHWRQQFGLDTVMGCDINRRHVDWVGRYLPQDIAVFQNSSIHSLPLPDNSLDLITAFSVFTHVETFDTTWLMELRRVLKKGGIAWVTIHGDRTWAEMAPGWPLYNALQNNTNFTAARASKTLPTERLIFRQRQDRSYSANVFYTYEYIKRTWGRLMSVEDIIPALPSFQDVVILRK